MPRRRRQHLVTIGNVGFDHSHTPRGKGKVIGGAAYFASKAASLFSRRVGIVTRAGRDFNLDFLRRLGIEMSGVRVIKTGKTFRWYSKYDQDFNVVKSRGELNVGDRVSPRDIPEHFLDAKHIHVASMHPRVQKRIIDYLKKRGCKAKISIDTVKFYIAKNPKLFARILEQVDIIFLN